MLGLQYTYSLFTITYYLQKSPGDFVKSFATLTVKFRLRRSEIFRWCGKWNEIAHSASAEFHIAKQYFTAEGNFTCPQGQISLKKALASAFSVYELQ